MNIARKKFLELVKKRAPSYLGRSKSIIEQKIDNMLKHNAVLLESVGEITASIDVPYAIVGGHAVTIHGSPRMTEDIDILALPEHVDEIVQKLNLDVSSPLTIGGVAATTPTGAEIDIIASDQPWLKGALSSAVDTEHGKVISKPYLVLTKIWGSRGVQDDADMINVLKNMTDEEHAEALDLVSEYFPNSEEDLESMIEIAKLGLSF